MVAVFVVMPVICDGESLVTVVVAGRFVGIQACDFDGFAGGFFQGFAKGVGNKGALMSDQDESCNHQRLFNPFQGLS